MRVNIVTDTKMTEDVEVREEDDRKVTEVEVAPVTLRSSYTVKRTEPGAAQGGGRVYTEPEVDVQSILW